MLITIEFYEDGNIEMVSSFDAKSLTWSPEDEEVTIRHGDTTTTWDPHTVNDKGWESIQVVTDHYCPNIKTD